jgi:hypothetical protein
MAISEQNLKVRDDGAYINKMKILTLSIVPFCLIKTTFRRMTQPPFSGKRPDQSINTAPIDGANPCLVRRWYLDSLMFVIDFNKTVFFIIRVIYCHVL